MNSEKKQAQEWFNSGWKLQIYNEYLEGYKQSGTLISPDGDITYGSLFGERNE